MLIPSLLFMVLAQDAAAPAPPAAAAPSQVIARVNGEELSLPAFADWIVRAHGWRHVDDFIDLALLKQEAVRQKLALPTPAEVDAEFERDWKDKCELRGGEEELLAELKRAGMDKATFRDRQLGVLEQETIARRILKTRPATEEMLHDLFTKEFGKDGMRNHVRVVFFDRLKGIKPGTTANKEAVQKMSASAHARAEEFYGKVKADRAQWAALVPETDRCLIQRIDETPVDARKDGGDVPRLHAEWFGGQVTRALGDAKAGDLLPPVDVPAGSYVVEVVAREPVKYEQVEGELKEIWQNRVPAAGEIYWLKNELRKAAKIEKLGLNPAGQ